jgi:DNA-binding YbaB/EbfC family protein
VVDHPEHDDDAPDELAGLPDIGGLLSGFQAMQEAQHAVYEGQAGGGVVKIRATGSMEFESVSIKKDAVDPDDVTMLEDLVLAALHDLSTRVAAAAQQALGGMDLGGLGDLGSLLGGLGGLGEPGVE